MREDDTLYERACVRWLGRFCFEAPEATLEDVQSAASNLVAVAMGFHGLPRDCVPRVYG